MVEPILTPATLEPRARLLLYLARPLPVEQRELVAGVLRAGTRREREERQRAHDFDVLADAARTPYKRNEASCA